MSGPALASLSIADPPEVWRELGFTVTDAGAYVGGVLIRLGAPGAGIVGWQLHGVEPGAEIDGLPWGSGVLSRDPEGDGRSQDDAHPNGAIGIDHVVVVTPDFDRTAGALERAGLGFRRIRDAGDFRQGFRRVGLAILEVVEAKQAPSGPARFWGLVVIVGDLESLAERLDERLGAIKDAVQPGRRIATLRESAGTGAKVAFMDPE